MLGEHDAQQIEQSAVVQPMHSMGEQVRDRLRQLRLRQLGNRPAALCT